MLRPPWPSTTIGFQLPAFPRVVVTTVVAVECLFCWYWVADLCEEQGFAFVLGHAFYMKAIHGGKTKNDRIDSHKIAALLRGGNLPFAYVYPRKMRPTRDLLRRHLFFARKRGERRRVSAVPSGLDAVAARV